MDEFNLSLGTKYCKKGVINLGRYMPKQLVFRTSCLCGCAGVPEYLFTLFSECFHAITQIEELRKAVDSQQISHTDPTSHHQPSWQEKASQ